MSKILVKWPTRQRPMRFFEGIQQYMQFSEYPNSVQYLVTCDEDDPTRRQYEQMAAKLPNTTIVFGYSGGKIAAVNRDMSLAEDWRFLVLASDDMVVKVKGWDAIVRRDLIDNFPSEDKMGVMWYDDGYGTNINCMPVMTREAYDRFGYIYCPEYQSLWCDNEFTEVWYLLKRQKKKDQTLFEHQHYARNSKFTPKSLDALMRHNEKFYAQDQQVYNRRKAINFGI